MRFLRTGVFSGAILAFTFMGQVFGADLLVFTAKWCGPCRVFKSDLENDPAMLDGYKVFVIDVNKEPELAKAHGVTTVPTFVLFAEGGKLHTKTGYEGKENLKAWLKSK